MTSTRRTLVKSAIATGIAASATSIRPAVARTREPVPVKQLFAKVEAALAEHPIPGAAVGIFWNGREYLRGFGVADVDTGQPVTVDTAFEIGSTSKTFTGSVIMKLVEQGRLRLDDPVRRYLPDFQVADETVARQVTIRQLLNHSAGWMGDYFTDTGSDDGALARYVASLADAPQETPLGQCFSYNNAAFGVAGRLIETTCGMPYESAVQELFLQPLGLDRSAFFAADLGGENLAASHQEVDQRPVADASLRLPRSVNPAGGLRSSVRDQIRYARFHLRHRAVPAVLSAATRHFMRSYPGPGGTLTGELIGASGSWLIRPTAQGVRVVEHGGATLGQISGFLTVPQRDFALTVLTNSAAGKPLVAELCDHDWALRTFAGLSNTATPTRQLPPEQLTEYVGTYVVSRVNPDGTPTRTECVLEPVAGELRVTLDGQSIGRLAFYRKDFAVLLDADGKRPPIADQRADFVRGADGRISGIRYGGRIALRADR